MSGETENENVMFWQLPWMTEQVNELSNHYDLVCIVCSEVGNDELVLTSSLDKNGVKHLVVCLEEEGSQNSEAGPKGEKHKPKEKEVNSKPTEHRMYKGSTVIPKDTSGIQLLLDVIAPKLSPEKHEAFLFSLKPITHERIVSKARLLKDRVWMTSLVASFQGNSGSRDSNVFESRDNGSGSRDKIYGSRDNLFGSRDNLFGSRDNLSGSRDNLFGSRGDLSISRDSVNGSNDVDTDVLIQEVCFLSRQFGLDPESIDALALKSGSSSREVYRQCQPWVEVLLGYVDPDTISRLFRVLGPLTHTKVKSSKRVESIENLSGAMNMPGSFGRTFYVLNKLIDLLSIQARSLTRRETITRGCAGDNENPERQGSQNASESA